MPRKITLFESFEDQEQYFLEYFYALTPSERLKKLAALQLKLFKDFGKPGQKKITIQTDGNRAS